MDSLGVTGGDMLKVMTVRKTVAKCAPRYPLDEEGDIIRIDGLIRNNAGVDIGDTIRARKIKVVPAEVVTLVVPDYTHMGQRNNSDGWDTTGILKDVPVTRGDYIMIPFEYVNGVPSSGC